MTCFGLPPTPIASNAKSVNVAQIALDATGARSALAPMIVSIATMLIIPIIAQRARTLATRTIAADAQGIPTR